MERLTRRRLLGRGTALGAAALGGSAFLAACGGSDNAASSGGTVDLTFASAKFFGSSTISDIVEGQMIGEMIAAASVTIIVTDASKFGRNAFLHIAPLTAIDVLVTDARPAPALMDELEAADVDVVIAD